MNSTCHLISPTLGDIAFVKSKLPPNTVTAFGEYEGGLTRSLCLEHSNGLRSWVFSRVEEPAGILETINAEFVYLDFYPELIKFFNASLEEVDLSRIGVIVNLSAISDIAGIPPLRFVPSVVQASIPGSITDDESMMFAARLRDKTGARMAFATRGHRGAALAAGLQAWYAAAPFKLDGSILGAGAVFSSTVIAGLLQGLSCRELLDFSVRQTAVRLQSWQANHESDCS